MKILVIGGMHGNEPLGIETVRRLKRMRPANVSAVFANEHAIKQGVRFTEEDLNRSFPGGGKSYESRRAAEIVALCESYDLVIDFHNTHCSDNDCSFVGQGANQLLYDVSAWLGLMRVILADYDCLNKYVASCISVEVSLTSKLMDVDWWVDKIITLAKLKKVPTAKGLERYRFAYRISIEDRDRLQLDQKQLKAFEPMDEKLALGLGVSVPAYPIFVADQYTPYNFGGIVNRINV